jgi:hypothetical protein
MSDHSQEEYLRARRDRLRENLAMLEEARSRVTTTADYPEDKDLAEECLVALESVVRRIRRRLEELGYSG